MAAAPISAAGKMQLMVENVQDAIVETLATQGPDEAAFAGMQEFEMGNRFGLKSVQPLKQLLRVCVRVCAWVCVCVCYKIFEMFEVCHVDSGDYTVCLCVSVSVSVSVLP